MIAREGFVFIFSGAALTILMILAAARWDSVWLFAVSLVFAVLTIFVTFFFRDPHRVFPVEPGILVAPADGKIVAVDTLDSHPFIGGAAVKVSIFLSVFDVHINRVPSDGVVDYVKYNPGKFLAAYKDKASEVNEQTEIGMTAPGGTKFVFKQIAGIIARRIVCKLNRGDVVKAGDRCGMIRFGSRTDLIVPKDSELLVKMGDWVKGAHTVMGYLPGYSPQASSTPAATEGNVKL